MKKTILSLIMVLCTLCSWGTEEEYDLWIQGERVTSNNCYELMWGMMRYDASSKTLSIDDGCWINNDLVNDYAIWNGIDGLTIQCNGMIGMEGMKGAVYSTEHFTISGNGADVSSVMITDNNADSPAIYAEKGVTIQQCEVDIYGVEDTGIEGGGMLALSGGKLYSNVVKGFEDMQYYNGSYLAYPENCQYDTVERVLGGDGSYVQVDVSIGYTLTVAGVEVTNDNAEDILGDQTVSYDSRTRTLTLRNAKLECEAEVISTSIDGLTIRVTGDNVLTTHDGRCIDYQGQNLTIEGYTPSRSALRFRQKREGTVAEDGTSSFSGNTLIRNCTVRGSKFVNASIGGPAGLDIERARITVANIEGFAEVNVSNAYIEAPVGCSYDKTQMCYVAGGEKVESLHIEPYLLAYNGQDVTPSNPIPVNSGVVTYDADARLLTMNNADLGEMTSGEGFALYDDLTIKLEGSNKLSAKSAALRFEAGDLTMRGPGRLQILADEDAFRTSYAVDENGFSNAERFGLDQYFTLKGTNLYCRTSNRKARAGGLIFNVIYSDFTFDDNPSHDVFVCRKMNLKYCTLTEPESFDIEQYYPGFDGKIVIEALEHIPGDLNADGEITTSDLTNMIRCLGLVKPDTDISLFDVDGDGMFTKKDIDLVVDMLQEK